MVNFHQVSCRIYFHNLQQEKALVFSKIVTWNSSHLGVPSDFTVTALWPMRFTTEIIYMVIWKRDRRVFLFSPMPSLPPTQSDDESCYVYYYFMSWWNIRSKLKIIGYDGLFGFLNPGANLERTWKCRSVVGGAVVSLGPVASGRRPETVCICGSLGENSSTCCLALSLRPSSLQSSSLIGHQGSLPQNEKTKSRLFSEFKLLDSIVVFLFQSHKNFM